MLLTCLEELPTCEKQRVLRAVCSNMHGWSGGEEDEEEDDDEGADVNNGTLKRVLRWVVSEGERWFEFQMIALLNGLHDEALNSEEEFCTQVSCLTPSKCIALPPPYPCHRICYY